MMAEARPSAKVSQARLWSRLEALAGFGALPDGGVNRQALSQEEIAARRALIGWGRELGLSAATDMIANLFLRFEGSEPDLAPVLVGSHIDSQPTGGKFDGAFGVLAALEALEALIESGLRPRRPIELVAWTNEEGSRFAPGMNGSTVFCAPDALPNVLDIKDAQGVSVGEAVARMRDAEADVPLRPLGWRPFCFIEPHIEQGPVLERAGLPVGVVTGIQGTRRYRVEILGEAAHAGTAAMAERRDALLAALHLIAEVEQAALAHADIKFTVGRFEIEPNAPSVVPARAYFSIDLRHPDNAVVDCLDRRLHQIVAAPRSRCAVRLQQIAHAPSLSFSPEIQKLLGATADALGIAHMPIYSAAGHDARQLHQVCPTGMIFIPCRGGISHNPAEWASPEHAATGARLLADALWSLASA